jgi:polyferredoxin
MTPRKALIVKKIPPGARRYRYRANAQDPWLRRFSSRLQGDSQYLRSTVQLAFVLLCVWIGIEFYLFTKWGFSGGASPHVSRPPGVDGFLPISGLISLKYWLTTGIINTVHPAGLFILLAIIALGLLLKKGFCSWLCPVGTLSESLWMLGQKIFGRNLSAPRWLDYPLRSLKYLLLYFFLQSVLAMDGDGLRAFIQSPYNKTADIKMYLFFANLGTFALWTIVILMLLSVAVKNFWCRYLCPYGALLGALSWLSPLKITRNTTSCIDCELCTKACPANIRVHAVKRVRSDECTACLQCVEACPVKATLDLSVAGTRVPSWLFGTLIVGVFVAITGLAVLAGHWQNGIGQTEYLKRFKEIDAPVYQHFRGQVPRYTDQD